ncbi:MAG: acyltransferase domain-containing protein, partial [Arenimonas sp.]
RAAWDRSADLQFESGTTLHELVFPRPGFNQDAAKNDNACLTATQWAQPAIGATSLSMLALLNDCGIHAELLGGHSFGEVVALHAAGVLSETDMLKVARRRGELMAQTATTPGAMTALSLPIEQVCELISRCASSVVVANHNAPQQVVVSGTKQAIEEFETQIHTQGVAFRRLPVASGFHSQVVASACEPFAEFLADIEFATPNLPVFANASAAKHAPDAKSIRAALAAQIAQPVRFVEMIEAMYADGARSFLEVGPGNVLTGLIGTILGDRPHSAINVDRKNKDGVESLLVALARLAANGVEMNLERLFTDIREPAIAATHGRPMTPINGSNVGKPYPPVGGKAALPKPNPPRPANTITHVEMPVNSTSAKPVIPQEIPAAMPMQITPVANVNTAWLQAFQSSQQQLADAHASFQRSMFESHAAFLQLSESSLNGLASMVTGQTHTALPQATFATALTPTPVPMVSPAIITSVVPEKVMPPIETRPAPVIAAPPIAAVATVAAPSFDLTALMLQIVAEKTGYPVDMLNLGMDLEGDLGIDSIKRVEILAAVDERAPGLPKLDRSAMSALHTVGEIVEYLQGQQGAVAATNATAEITTSVAAPAFDLTALMLQIVAEKTGYPVDMLNLGMDLEGDLGIDSIKRVEILA